MNVSDTAVTVLDLARAGRFAEIRELFAPQLRAMVPAGALEAAWTAEAGRHGQVTAVGVPVAGPARAGSMDVKIPVTFEHGELLAGWQAALAGRPDVTVRVYEAGNHLFFPGTGPSAPAEYVPVVDDIASWLTAGVLAS